MSLIAFRILKYQNKIYSISLVDDNLNKKDIPAQQLLAALTASKDRRVEINNIGVDNKRQLIGTNGQLSRYPELQLEMNKQTGELVPKEVINGKAVTILGKYSGGSYLVIRIDGKTSEITEKELIEACNGKGYSLSNASIVEGKFIRSINGTFRDLGVSEKAQNNERFNQKLEELKKEQEEYKKAYDREKEQKEAAAKMVTNQTKVGDTSKEKLGYVTVDNTTKQLLSELRKLHVPGNVIKEEGFDTVNVNYDEFDESVGMTVYDKFLVGGTVLKYIDTFLYATYLALNFVVVQSPTQGINSFGVTDTKMYVVLDAVKERTLSQISYLMVHEMYHIMLRHPARKKDRDPYLWNVVCDLFINKLIDDIYNCKPGTPVQKALYNNKSPIGLEFPVIIHQGESIVQSLYHPDIDTYNKTEEQLYDEMYKENEDKIRDNKDKQQEQNQSEQGQNQQGQGQDESGQGENGQGENGQNGSGQSGQGQGQSGSEQGQSGQGQSGQGQGQSGQGQNGQGSQNASNYLTYKGVPIAPNKVGQNNYGQGNSNSGGEENGNSQGSGLNGKTVEINEDIRESAEDAKLTQAERETKAQNFVRSVVQKAKDMGEGTSAFLRKIELSMINDPSWQSFVKRFMIKASNTESSFKTPNKKMMNHGLVLPGPNKGDNDTADCVYVAIDTSGSITDEELTISLSYILSVMKSYKLSGYVVFWDTEVRDVIKFEKINDIVSAKNKAHGGGGTDINCFFRYVNSRACKNKPKLMIVITDGYFGDITVKPMRTFGDLIWVITDYSKYLDFKPGFGFKAPFRKKNS